MREPTKGPEAAAAEHADRYVYPADVRDQPQLHAKDMVVWAGILKAHEEYVRIIRRSLYTDQALNYGRAKK